MRDITSTFIISLLLALFQHLWIRPRINLSLARGSVSVFACFFDALELTELIVISIIIISLQTLWDVGLPQPSPFFFVNFFSASSYIQPKLFHIVRPSCCRSISSSFIFFHLFILHYLVHCSILNCISVSFISHKYLLFINMVTSSGHG